MSEFSTALGNIINSDSFLSKEDWNHFLYSSDIELENWLHDVSLPAPYQLKTLLDIANSLATKNSQKILESFIVVLNKPAIDITPVQQQFNTLNEYMQDSEVKL